MADSENGLDLFLNDADSSVVQYAVMPNATQNKDPVLAHAAKFLVKKYGSFSNIPPQDQFLTVCFQKQKQKQIKNENKNKKLIIFFSFHTKEPRKLFWLGSFHGTT